MNERTGEVEPTSQLVSTIREATTSTVQRGQTNEYENVSFPPSPYLVGDSINGTREAVDSIHVGITFGRTSKQCPPSNNSTISSIIVNGKSYQGPIFDERGNRLN